MNADIMTLYTRHVGSHLNLSELIALENVATQKNFHGNNDSAARGLQRFIRGKRIVDWKISNHPQVRLEFFEHKTGK